MTLPDYRIRFSSSKIDFDEDVHGGSPDGQDINDFPAPGSQARYDWMRMIIIGLLANQSSTEEPVNYKIGSLWYNLNDEFLKYFNGENWSELAKAIRIDNQSLEEWSEIVENTIGKVTETVSFSGTASSTITEINIPDSALDAAGYENNHPILYKNGLICDPRLTSFNVDKDKVLLLETLNLKKNDEFVVVIERIDTVVSEIVVV